MNGWREPPSTPSVEGVYLVLAQQEQRYARWTGKYWTHWGPSAERAAKCQWRGRKDGEGYPWREIDQIPAHAI
jgi:hypothetical protein